MTVRILQGDCRDVLRTLPGDSVNCVVTSPPYWGLRDYGVDGQMGLEPSVDEWVVGMVAVFDEVRRVLRPDGTLWLNLGDSYAGSGRGGNSGASTMHSAQPDHSRAVWHRGGGMVPHAAPAGLKPKDLIGQPWLLAFALRADGWWLRQDIVWHKPNPMPESVRDRCTKAHEYVFLLSKSDRYYWDFDAMQEPVNGNAHARRAKTPEGWDTSKGDGGRGSVKAVGRRRGPPGNPAERKLAAPGSGTKNNTSFEAAVAELVDTRNKRSVWTVGTEPFSEAHFATFPPALIEPCIKAGCPVGGTVLDPFGGAGTTGLVADGLQRDAILIELNPEYAAMARRRIAADAPLFAEVTA